MVRWERFKKILAKTYIYLVLLLMYAPILVLVVYSFTDSDQLGIWNGFSFKLYVDLFKNESLMDAFGNTLLIAVVSGIVSAATMVFMPTISSYVISDILSEYNVVLFGSYIDLYFNQSDWNFGSFMALIMLVLILISVPY